MNKLCRSLLLLCFPLGLVQAQPGYTAHDTIIPSESPFRYGANMGAYHFWTDEQLADIAAGNPGKNVVGVGVDALRPLLSEWFLEYWGYDIRLDAFEHYGSLGMEENVVFIGYPSEAHRDTAEYCKGVQSLLFANLYEPIWDDGENGTPVNDDNYFALYLWEMVSRYHPNVRYWEIWNEPDFDFVGKSSLPPGDPSSWWQQDPDPCDYALHAPVQHYIRMLRISYEVIKTIAPEDYIALGGIGYPGFLDALLRNTDNPAGGSVDSLYPLKGGAYFDVVSFHSYPHIDNSLRIWSDEAGGFVYSRHSDRCVEGFLRRKNDLQAVLDAYGYDGSLFPEKLWIVTESNIPRIRTGEFIGSVEAQRNYLIKALVACQQNDIRQFHVYQLGDIRKTGFFSEYYYMGLFAPLDSVPPYEQEVLDAGVAYRTTSMLLKDMAYSAERTAAMYLPDHIAGAAFRNKNGADYTYVLWAKTQEDRSETAHAHYNFPPSFNMDGIHQREWDFSRAGITKYLRSSTVTLTGSPRFFTSSKTGIPADPVPGVEMEVHPNPFAEQLIVELALPSPLVSSLGIYDVQGRLVHLIFRDVMLAEGSHVLQIDGTGLPPGMYLLLLEAGTRKRLSKRVIRR